MCSEILLKATISREGQIAAGAIAVLFVIIAAYRRISRKEKIEKYYKLLAKNLGLTIDRSTWSDSYSIIMEAAGKIKRIPIEIYTEEKNRNSRRNSSIYYTTVRISIQKNRKAQFSISNENLLHKIVRVIGIDDTITGHAEFDKAFVLQTENPEKVLQVFDMEICTRFAEYQTIFYSSIDVTENLMIYKERTTIASPEDAERFEIIAGLMIDLAERVNKVSGKD